MDEEDTLSELQAEIRADALALLKQQMKINLDDDILKAFQDYTKNKDSSLLTKRMKSFSDKIVQKFNEKNFDKNELNVLQEFRRSKSSNYERAFKMFE